jgi:thiol-disulfide isomerase/thioredoxin
LTRARDLVVVLATILPALGSISRGVTAEPPPSAMMEGVQMEDFGLRALDFGSGRLGPIVWLSDFVGGSVADTRVVGRERGQADRARTRLVLLNFFAVWCKPCVAELPVLARLQSAHAEDGLQVISVNYRTDAEPAEEAMVRARQLWAAGAPNFPVLFDRYTNRNQLLYVGRTAVLPCNVLIDQAGSVVARFQGGAPGQLQRLEERILQLLHEGISAPRQVAP